jgi:hypothetical protein
MLLEPADETELAGHVAHALLLRYEFAEQLEHSIDVGVPVTSVLT